MMTDRRSFLHALTALAVTGLLPARPAWDKPAPVAAQPPLIDWLRWHKFEFVVEEGKIARAFIDDRDVSGYPDLVKRVGSGAVVALAHASWHAGAVPDKFTRVRFFWNEREVLYPARRRQADDWGWFAE